MICIEDTAAVFLWEQSSLRRRLYVPSVEVPSKIRLLSTNFRLCSITFINYIVENRRDHIHFRRTTSISARKLLGISLSGFWLGNRRHLSNGQHALDTKYKTTPWSVVFVCAMLPVSVKKTVLRRRRPMGTLASKSPNQGPESSFCCWSASSRFAQNECFVRRHRLSPPRELRRFAETDVFHCNTTNASCFVPCYLRRGSLR